VSESDRPGRVIRIGWYVGCPFRWLLVYQLLGWLAALGWAVSDVMDELRCRAGYQEPARTRTDIEHGAA